MAMTPNRRTFLTTSAAAVGAAVWGGGSMAQELKKYPFDISLAGWSLHRTIGKGEDKKPMLDMPKIARQEFDIGAIELVSTMLLSTEKAYLDELAKNASDNDVKLLLIMIDGQGNIASEKEDERAAAVANHKTWIDIANGFGCHSIRMNWAGAPQDVMEKPEVLTAVVERSAPYFRQLCEYGDTKDINVIIENHWGPSSYPRAMEQLIGAVDHPRFGTLPDFGNFPDDVDKYEAIDALMNHAKALSAKCYDFDDETGMETKLDYPRLLEICCGKHGYNGYIGIEYEGDRLSEYEGIAACKKLLDRMRA